MSASKSMLPAIRLSRSRRSVLPTLLAAVLMLATGSSLLAEQATIQGFVTGQDQNGENTEVLVGAKVEFTATDGGGAVSAISDENGMYRISELSAQQYSYRITAAGYLEQSRDPGFELVASENAHVLHFILTKRPKTSSLNGLLSGVVVGRKDDQRNRLAGASVILKHDQSGEIRQLDTDANGNYQANLSPGIWYCVAAAQGYQQGVSPSKIEMVADRDQTHDIELVAQLAGPTNDPNQPLEAETTLAIHGRIFAQDELGENLGTIAGATIELSGSTSGTVTTDENGFFLFETAEPGDATYRAAAAGYLSQTNQIQLSAVSGTYVLDLILTKGKSTAPARLTGQVLEEVDGERRIVPTAVVKLDHLDFPSSFDLPVDSVAGKYVCEEMEPGRWRATVTAAGFKPYVHDSFLELPAGQRKEQDFVLQRVDPDAERDSTHSAIVSVETTSETEGLPRVKFVDVATGAIVQGEVQTEDAETDVLDNGEIRWQVYTVYPQSALSAGDYQAVAELGSMYEDGANGPLRVEPEESTVFNLTLRLADKPPAPARLAGIVVEEVDGKRTPIPNAVVELVHLEQAAPPLKLPVANAAGEVGQYSGNDLIPGQWRVMVSAPGFKPHVAEAPIALAAGEEKRKDFVLQRGERESSTTAVVSAQLGDSNDESPQVNFVNVETGATVIGVAEDYSGDSVGGWKVLAYYPERKLPAGDYRAEAMQAGHVDDTSNPQAVTAESSTVFDLTLRVAPPEHALLAGGVYERVDSELVFVPGAVVTIVHLDSPAKFDIEVKKAEADSKNYIYRKEELTPGRWRASVSAGSDFEPYVHPTDIVLRPGEQKRQDFVLTRRTADRNPSTTAVVSMEMTTENRGTPHVQFINVESGLAIDGKVSDGGGELLQDEESDWQVLIYSPVRTLPPGDYRAQASQRGFRDDSNGPKPVDRERSTVFDLLLRPVAPPQVGAMWISVLGQYGEEEPEQISDAIVTLRNEETGERRKIEADESGDYYASQLDAGQWNVSARIEGMPAVSDTVTIVAGHEAERELLIKVKPPELFVIVGTSRSLGEAAGALRAAADSVTPQVQLVDEFGDLTSTAMQAVNPQQLANIGVEQADLPEGEFRWFGGRCSQVDGPGRYFAMAKMAGYKLGYSSAQEVEFGQRKVFVILLRPEPAGGLLVKVEDLDHQPLADATVSVADASGTPVQITWNNEVKAYLIESVSPGQFSVTASVGDWDLARTSHQGGKVLVQDGQLATVTYTFKRPPPPRLVVRVERKVEGIATGREVVKNAKVMVKPGSTPSWTTPWNQPLQSLPDGNYSVVLNSMPPSGLWDYSVEAPDRKGEPERGQVKYRTDGGPMLIVLEPLPKPAPLLVKVLSIDEVKISKPVSDATVFLKREGMDRPIKLTQAEGDEAGLYRFDMNAPMTEEQWQYSVKAPGAEDFTTGQVTIKPGEVAVINLKSEGMAVPRGPTVLLVNVYKNRNRAPADPNSFVLMIENQTKGKEFRLRKMAKKVGKTNEFEEQRDPGNYLLTVTVPGKGTWKKEIVLKNGLTQRIDFYLEPPTFEEVDNPPNPGTRGKLSGKVFLQKGRGVQDKAANATVLIRQGDKGRIIELTTDTNGEFATNEIESGMWRVVAEVNGQKSPVNSINVTSGQSTECSLVVTEPPPAQIGSLLISVSDQKNRPLADASVFLRKTEGGDLTQAETGSNGKCQVDSLASGEWQVVATSNGASSEQRSVTIHAGKRDECDLTIVRSKPQDPVEPPSNTLQGDWDIVEYRDQNDRDGERWGTITIDADGRFLRERFDGGAPARGSLKIVNGILEMSFGGRPEPVSFRRLGDGRFEVGGFTWEPRRSSEPPIVTPLPVGTKIPANLVGSWNILAPKNGIDRTMSLWGTIVVDQNGAYFIKPRGERGTIGDLKLQDGFLYLEDKRLALRETGKDQLRVGENTWQRLSDVAPRIPDRPLPNVPASEAIPAGLLGRWVILAPQNENGGTMIDWGTIDIGQEGTYLMRPIDGVEVKRGKVEIQKGYLLLSGERLKLHAAGKDQFLVGEMIWERPGRARPQFPIRPEPNFPAPEAIPAGLLGSWDILAPRDEVDSTDYVWGTIDISRTGSFVMQPRDGRAVRGQIRLGDGQIFIDREQHRFQSLGEGRFQVGDVIWVRRDQNRNPIPQPPLPVEAPAIPAPLVGNWNVRAFEGPLDETGFLKGSITVYANGTFMSQSGAVRKQGTLRVEGQNIRVVYNNGGGTALLSVEEVQGVGFMVGDQLWEKELDRVMSR